MAYANLNREGYEINGFDSIIIVKDNGDIPCGVTLDVTGVTAETIQAGHILVQNTTTKAVSPLSVSDGAYVSLPAGHAYYGVLKASVLKKLPMAAVLRAGTVNAAAAGKAVAEITSTIKSGLPHIDFIY